MSIHCSNRVWEYSNQKGSSLFLLIALADYADANGFAWPGLQALARKTRLSSRHVSRLVAGLQAAGELLVLPRPGRSHLYVVLTGTARELLAAALQKAADRGAVVDGILDATLDRSPNTGDSLSGACPPERTAATQDRLSPPTHESASPNTGGVSGTHDIAMSSPTHDILSGTHDILSGTHDIAMSSDPSLSVIDPSVKEGWHKILKTLSGQMTRATFDHCLRGSHVIRVEDNVWTVQIRYRLALDWIEHRLADSMLRTLAHYLPGVQVRFVARGAPRYAPSTPPEPAPEPAPVAVRPPSSAVRSRSCTCSRPVPPPAPIPSASPPRTMPMSLASPSGIGPVPNPQSSFPHPPSPIPSPPPPSYLCFRIMFTHPATVSVGFNLL